MIYNFQQITMPELKLSDSTRIYYEYVTGSKPAIVFIHGLGANCTVWQKESVYFQDKGCATLSLDLRGHGLSSKIAPKFNDFSKDLFELVRKNRLDKIILVGHSMGGLIALDYYKKHPKNVAAIILVDSSYKISLKTLRIFAPIAFILLQIVGFFANLRKKKKRMNFQKFRKKSDFRIMYELNSSLDAIPYAMDIVKELRKTDFSRMLKKIDVPVLVISSRDDEFFRISASREMAGMIPEGHLQIIKGTHSSIIKKGSEIGRIIDRFVADYLSKTTSQ